MKKLKGPNLNNYLKELDLDDTFASKDNDFILSYLSQFNSYGNSSDKGVTVYRARLILVGAGNVGKTTLVKRLKSNISGPMKQEARKMTDGIDISEIKFNVDASTEVVLTVMDFAGQKDYMQTHSLFFRKDSIFLVLHKHEYENSSVDSDKEHELKLFLRMIESCAFDARVIFSLTHCAEKKRGSWNKLSQLQEQYRLIFTTGEPLKIDSIAGLNIDVLKKIILEEATTDKNKVRVPASFFKFKDELAKKAETLFSVTDAEFKQVAKTFLEKGAISQERDVFELISLAKDVFELWGIIYKLSNGDIVLRPQNLADVFSCLFTKEGTTLARIQGHIFGGYLRHTKEALEAVWGIKDASGQYRYPKALWSLGPSNAPIPFIELLHQSGLAYPITSMSGKPLSAVPFLLPDAPLDIPNFADMSEQEMFESLFQKDLLKTLHTPTDIIFNPHLPPAFVGQLQSKVSWLTLKGGAWQSGCALQSKDNKSCAVFCLSRSNPNAIRVHSGGIDASYTHARDIVITAVSDLIRDKFESLVCEVTAVSDAVKVATKVSFRWTSFSVKKQKGGFQFSNLIDKDGMHNISLITAGTEVVKGSFRTTNFDPKTKEGFQFSYLNDTGGMHNTSISEIFADKSLNKLYNSRKETSVVQLTNYLWYAVPDLLKITIGQTRDWNNCNNKLRGLWLVFKDDKDKSKSYYHAIHFYYSDRDNKWLRDICTDSIDNETIKFEASADDTNKDTTSNKVIEVIKCILKDRFNVKLPSLLSGNKSTDLWSLLVTISIDDEIAEKLIKHEEHYFGTQQTLQAKEPQIRRSV